MRVFVDREEGRLLETPSRFELLLFVSYVINFFFGYDRDGTSCRDAWMVLLCFDREERRGLRLRQSGLLFPREALRWTGAQLHLYP